MFHRGKSFHEFFAIGEPRIRSLNMRAIGVLALTACGRFGFLEPSIDSDHVRVVAGTQSGTISVLEFDLARRTLRGVMQHALGGEIADLLLDHDGAYLHVAGAVLATYDVGATTLTELSRDGGGFAVGRMRLVQHPSLPVLYMTGDGPITTNVFVYDITETGSALRTTVGEEANPGGIDLDAAGDILYTTSFAGTEATVCYHAVSIDGTLSVASGYVPTCYQPIELFAASSAIVVACASGEVAVHALDAQRVPGPMRGYSIATSIRGAVMSSDGVLFVATASDEIVRIDTATGAELGRATVRAGTSGLALTSDERHLIAGDSLGAIVYDSHDTEVVATWDGDLAEPATTLATTTSPVPQR